MFNNPLQLRCLLLLVLIPEVLCAESPRPGSAQGADLVDARGRTVALDKPAARIVSLLPSLTEYLFELDQGHRLVGRTNWCRFPPESQSIAVVGGPENPVVESILAMTPDVILAGPFLREEQVDHLESLNLEVVTFDHHNWATIVRDLSLLGKIIDREEDVQNLIRRLDEKRRSIAAQSRNEAGTNPSGPSFSIPWSRSTVAEPTPLSMN